MEELGLQVLPILTNKKPLRDVSHRQRPKGLSNPTGAHCKEACGVLLASLVRFYERRKMHDCFNKRNILW